MLMIPKESSNIVTIMGLDPGSSTFGISLLNINLETMEIVSSNAWTINGAKLINKNSWMEQLYGNRFSRVSAIENYLLEIFRLYRPTSISSESPFINNAFPAAGIALTEVICAIRRSVMHYDIWMELHMVPPSSVKNAVKAIGNADKFVMKEKLKQLLPILKYNGEVPFDSLDEHSIDALAVVYYTYLTYTKGSY